jgi:hypothetical protein
MSESQAAIVRWNDQHEIGTAVIYESIKGIPETRRNARTTSPAFASESGTAVIFIEGTSGYVALGHVVAVATSEDPRD